MLGGGLRRRISTGSMLQINNILGITEIIPKVLRSLPASGDPGVKTCGSRYRLPRGKRMVIMKAS